MSNLLLGIVTAVFLFAVGITFLNFVMPDIDVARNSLNCSGDISDGAKALCLAIDLLIPYLIVLILSIAGGLITAKYLI